MELTLVPAFPHKDQIRELFQEYTDMLVAGDPLFAEYLLLQNYDDKLAHLEHKYGLPKGRLYLLFCNGEAAGCIGLKPLDGDSCELKRLYIKPAFQKLKVAPQVFDFIEENFPDYNYQALVPKKNEIALGVFTKRGYDITIL